MKVHKSEYALHSTKKQQHLLNETKKQGHPCRTGYPYLALAQKWVRGGQPVEADAFPPALEGEGESTPRQVNLHNEENRQLPSALEAIHKQPLSSGDKKAVGAALSKACARHCWG